MCKSTPEPNVVMHVHQLCKSQEVLNPYGVKAMAPVGSNSPDDKFIPILSHNGEGFYVIIRFIES